MNAQEIYEEGLKNQPNYHDGSKRKAWGQLGEVEKWTWSAGVDAVCPRCERPILGHELSSEYGGEIFHIDCAADETDEIGFDDDFGSRG